MAQASSTSSPLTNQKLLLARVFQTPPSIPSSVTAEWWSLMFKSKTRDSAFITLTRQRKENRKTK
ncbi:Retrovirus-related Pol polyprotein from transposon 17.6 [Sesbania bispinosa]|nr:Retrovirus-related Pol polyprotein from transposon 17.6 [Sesbania bispinosa]